MTRVATNGHHEIKQFVTDCRFFATTNLLGVPMKLSCFAVAAALAVSSLAVSAETIYPYEIYKSQTTFTTLGGFHEIYDYYLAPGYFPGNAADVGWAFTELKFKDITNIKFSGDAAVKFYDDTGLVASGTPVPGAGGPADTLSFDFFTVHSQHFWLTIDGEAIGTGPNKGSYSFEIEAAPVPEPTTYSLALGGLALIGVATAKRRRVAAQAAA